MSNKFAVVESDSGDVAYSRTYTSADLANEGCPPYDHFVAELVPVLEIEELRDLATSKKNLTALCVAKNERIQFLENELRASRRTDSAIRWSW